MLLAAPANVQMWVFSVSMTVGLALAAYWIDRERRLWVQRQQSPLTDDEARFFGRQYRRRRVSSCLMACLAAVFFAAMMLSTDNQPMAFLVAWLGVLLLLFSMMIVAVADIFAIRRFAFRQTQRLARQKRDLLEAEQLARRSDARRPGSEVSGDDHIDGNGRVPNSKG